MGAGYVTSSLQWRSTALIQPRDFVALVAVDRSFGAGCFIVRLGQALDIEPQPHRRDEDRCLERRLAPLRPRLRESAQQQRRAAHEEKV